MRRADERERVGREGVGERGPIDRQEAERPARRDPEDRAFGPQASIRSGVCRPGLKKSRQ
ncbi:hypothetical protein [Amaricoccus sp.]|uniref:hypothetical protein n=1 Tax=Amaricoccus sp. TaxID=1872485 RepID=UPI001B4FCB60|nr:hypothetical protein [Amaricoccus sp.]MBP7243520.1 hypothetical protein [Amaricoccus sp.]